MNMQVKGVVLYMLLVTSTVVFGVYSGGIDMLKGNCTCGGFSSEIPNPEDAPLVSQSPGLVVTCDVEGDMACKTLCLALSTAAKAKGPDVLCKRIVNANSLKLSAFYKICEGPWTFTGMTSDQLLCCEESKPKACPCHDTFNASHPVTNMTST